MFGIAKPHCAYITHQQDERTAEFIGKAREPQFIESETTRLEGDLTQFIYL